MKSWLRITLIIIVFLLINLIFNFSLWKETFNSKVVISDNIITEYLVETSYQNILHFKNPFITNTILYPFTTNFSMNDPNTTYVLPFFILRPFFDSHKSIFIITLFSFFLNNFFMYLLLRKLKINQNISIVMALVFGFTPFLSHRILGHYTYIPIYFFPLVFLIILKFIEAKKGKEKIIISLLLGLSIALILLSNFYYFFMIILGFIFYFSYWFFTNRKQFLQELTRNAIYLFTSIISIIFFLIPWIISVYDLIKTQGLVKSPGFGGAITLSADVLSFFTPSEYNPIYKFLFNKLSLIIPYFSKYNNFFLKSWERFAYFGVIILGIYFLIILLKLLKKFPISLWDKIKSYFLMSLVFAVLMLGPFLKIFNRWSINIEGVAVVFPLPFLLLHYIPGLSTLRAPARFTPVFVFFACIVVAYTLDYLIGKISKKKSLILIISLFIIFFLDQFYFIPTKLSQKIPNKIYNYLNKKPQGTVLEIPFTVRDGFQYIGFVHAIQPMAGQLIHGKPIIGGYIARVPDIFFSYYKNLKFIGYIAKIIDKGNYNPLTEKPIKPIVYKFPYQIDEIKKELDLLNVKYIILKQNEVYTNVVRELIMVSNYRPILTESQYELYEN